eukprot:728670-Pleurochrysis_carterae.AAC.3
MAEFNGKVCFTVQIRDTYPPCVAALATGTKDRREMHERLEIFQKLTGNARIIMQSALHCLATGIARGLCGQPVPNKRTLVDRATNTSSVACSTRKQDARLTASYNG